MKLIPQGTKLIVEILEKPDITKGGIHIPQGAQAKSTEGVVLAAGPGHRILDTLNDSVFVPDDCVVTYDEVTKAVAAFHTPRYHPLTIKVGDRVVFSKYGGNEVEIDGKTYTILDADSVLSVLEED